MAAKYKKAPGGAVRFAQIGRASLLSNCEILKPFPSCKTVTESASNPVVLYDGVCGLCNGLNQFLLKRDRHDRFRFASLQSEFAAALLKRHGVNSVDLDTFYLVDNYGQSNEQPGVCM